MREKKVINIPSSKMKPIFPTKIVMVWSLVFLGIIIYTVAWFTSAAVAMTYIEAITDSVSFSSPWDNVVTLTKNVILLHPVIAIGGWFFYGFLSSMKRDVTTWKVG